MGAKNGRAYALYLGTTAPSTADDSTDGNYDKVLLVREHNLDEVVEAIDITTKDDGDDTSYAGARADRDLSFSALLDTANAAGQDYVQNAIEDGSTHTIYWLLTTDVSGDLEWYGQAVPTSRSMSFPDGGPATLDVSMKVSGALTEQTV